MEEARAVIEEFLSGSLSALFQLTWNIPVPGVCTCVFNVDASVHLSPYLRPGYYETFCCEGGLELNLADGSNHTIRENEYFF